jgi:hypothetical protein
VLDRRQAWGEARVYFRNAAGALQRIPLQWTSLAAVDPFTTVNAGRSSLRLEELLQLVEIVRRLKAARQGGRKAGNVK